ncbi:glycoside hydrolase family protein [bacterium]|nr:glycoside hydrolase family protein [bacterium]
MTDRIRALIAEHEGFRADPYQDSEGNWTVGYGHLIGREQPSEAESALFTADTLENIFDADIRQAKLDVAAIFPNAGFSYARYAALVDMAFQLGRGRLRGFRRMIDAIGRNNWRTAAEEALDSDWARAYERRAQEISRMLETGLWE